MKNNLVLNLSFLVFSLHFGGCISDPVDNIRKKANNDKDFLTEITWDYTNKDFGEIEEGQKLEVIYRFTNKGKKPLVIKNAKASCGCTVPSIPKEPIMPGQTGLLKAIFDSNGRPGENHKNITVFTNTNPGEQTLDFSVKVKPLQTGPIPK